MTMVIALCCIQHTDLPGPNKRKTVPYRMQDGQMLSYFAYTDTCTVHTFMCR